jgi:hypothetical protein
LLLTLTGLALSYADRLGLSSRSAASPLVLRLYGIEPPAIDVAFAAAGLPVASAGAVLVAGDTVLDESASELRGAVTVAGNTVVATRRQIYLLTSAGQLIETVALGRELEILELGRLDDTVLVATNQGLRDFDSHTMQLNLRAAVDGTPEWSQAMELDSPQRADVQQAVLSDSISWSRLVADMHSGRIVPVIGPLLVDLSALCLLYLAVSGLYLGLRRR